MHIWHCWSGPIVKNKTKKHYYEKFLSWANSNINYTSLIQKYKYQTSVLPNEKNINIIHLYFQTRKILIWFICTSKRGKYQYDTSVLPNKVMDIWSREWFQIDIEWIVFHIFQVGLCPYQYQYHINYKKKNLITEDPSTK